MLETSGDATGPASRGARHRWPGSRRLADSEAERWWGAERKRRGTKSRELWGKRRFPREANGESCIDRRVCRPSASERDHNTPSGRERWRGGGGDGHTSTDTRAMAEGMNTPFIRCVERVEGRSRGAYLATRYPPPAIAIFDGKSRLSTNWKSPSSLPKTFPNAILAGKVSTPFHFNR